MGYYARVSNSTESQDGAMRSAVRRGVEPEGWKGYMPGSRDLLGVIEQLYIHS